MAPEPASGQHHGDRLGIGLGHALEVGDRHGRSYPARQLVSDIEAVRDDLVRRGVDVSEVAVNRPPGFDDDARSYFARASFSDPDGNRWQLQEITTRLPGREWEG